MIQPVTADEVRANEFYRAMVGHLGAAGVRFLVGGAYALEHYTGIARRTKDLDVFVHPRERDAVLAVLAGGGCDTEVTSPVWLAKAFCGDDYVDVIFSSGNGIAEVDDTWFEHAVDADIVGVPVRLCAPEEMIWSKGYIMERERYDGADVAHILRSCAESLNWERLLQRFDPHWQLLLSYLVLFGFIYPSERHRVPAAVIKRTVAAHADGRPPERSKGIRKAELGSPVGRIRQRAGMIKRTVARELQLI